MMVDALTDAGDDELAKRIAEGDAASLGVMFQRYHADVRRFIGRLGVRGTDVDDLAQQTFMQLATAARNFDGRASARAWIFGVAAMMVRRHRFSVVRLAKRLASWSVEQDTVMAIEPADALETRERAARAAEALSKLSQKKREVFVMVVLEESRGEEVAAALGIPLATVWTRLHHARLELRAHLSEDS